VTCDCRCCADGKPCARRLVLDRDDERAANKLSRAAAIERGPLISSPRAEAARVHEPTTELRCGECFGMFDTPVWLAEFASKHHAKLPCDACSERRRVA